MEHETRRKVNARYAAQTGQSSSAAISLHEVKQTTRTEAFLYNDYNKQADEQKGLIKAWQRNDQNDASALIRIIRKEEAKEGNMNHNMTKQQYGANVKMKRIN